MRLRLNPSRFTNRLLVLLTIALAIGFGGTASTAGDAYWHTSGSQIVDSSGAPIRMSGVNWYGFETTDFIAHGLWAQSYQSILNTIKNLGYNVIRIPFSNQMVESNPVPTNYNAADNPDLNGLTSLEILDKIITYAGQIGLRVILDNHRSEAGDSAEANGLWYTSAYPQSAWINDWITLANRYNGNATVVAFDLRNEPHNSAGWGDGNTSTDWRLAAETAGNAVQAVNPNLLICVEGIQTYNGDSDWWGGNLEGAGSFPVVLSVANQVVYSAHDYGPNLSGQPWFNSSTTYSSLVATWTKYWGYLAIDGTAPVWVGEFGTTNVDTDIQDSAAGSQGQWFQGLVQFLSDNSEINWTYWALNGEDSYALLDSNYDPTPLSALKQQMLASIQGAQSSPGATPTPSSTPTRTPTPTGTPTATPTSSATNTPVPTASATPAPTPSPTPAPGFSVGASSSRDSVRQGEAAIYEVTITPTSGFKGAVNLAASGLPSHSTATFTPKSISGTRSAKLKIITHKSTAVGSYTATVSGVAGAISQSTSISIDVTAKPER